MAVSVVAGIALGWAALRAPGVVPAQAPATVFSAERAMVDLRAIAAEGRPTGSPANAAARERILGALRATGLDPVLQETTAVDARPGAARTARVVNVLARIEGTAGSDDAVLFAAHYDTFSAATPSASDDGLGVAALLETLRAVQAGPRPVNDLVFLFTDAEERVSLGARAFTAEHAWAGDVRVMVNVEAAGTEGPTLLLDVTPDSGPLVNAVADGVRDPAAFSFLPLMWQVAPNGDDMEVFRQDLRRPGTDLIGNVFDRAAYHTARDNLATLDERSVQHAGEHVLSLARFLGATSWDQVTGPDRVFFETLPGVVTSYPASWALPLALVVSAALAVLTVLGVRHARLRLRTVISSAALCVGMVPVAVAVGALVWAVVEALSPTVRDTLVISTVAPYDAGPYLVAVVAVTVAVASAIFLWWGRRAGMASVAAGAGLAWAVLAILTSALIPGASYLFTWPLACALLPLGICVLGNRSGWAELIATGVAVVVAVALWTPAVAVMFLAFGPKFPGLPVSVAGVWMIFVAMLAALLAFALEAASRWRRWLVPVVAAVIGVATLGYAVLTAAFDASHPKPNGVSYELDADAGTASWVTADAELDPWTSQFITGPTEPADYEVFVLPAFALQGVRTAAPMLDLPAPVVERLNVPVRDGLQRYRITSPRGARNALIHVTADAEIVEARIDGKPLIPASRDLRIGYAGVPARGVELALRTAGQGQVRVRVQDTSEGLPTVPGWAVPAREPWMMPLLTMAADPTRISKTYSFPVT
jgi:hypothetical protein